MFAVHVDEYFLQTFRVRRGNFFILLYCIYLFTFLNNLIYGFTVTTLRVVSLNAR